MDQKDKNELAELSENALFEKYIRFDDEHALAALYEKVKPGLLSLLQQQFPVLDAEHEDIIQKVFKSLLSNPNQFRQAGQKVFSFLAKCACNKAKDILRHEKPKISLDAAASGTTEEDSGVGSIAEVDLQSNPPISTQSPSEAEIEKLVRQSVPLSKGEKAILPDLKDPECWKKGGKLLDYQKIAERHGTTHDSAKQIVFGIRGKLKKVFVGTSHFLTVASRVLSFVRGALNTSRFRRVGIPALALLMLALFLIWWKGGTELVKGIPPQDNLYTSASLPGLQVNVLPVQTDTAATPSGELGSPPLVNPGRGNPSLKDTPTTGEKEGYTIRVGAPKIRFSGFPSEVVFYHHGIGDERRKKLSDEFLKLVANVSFVEIESKSQDGYIFYNAEGGKESRTCADSAKDLIEQAEPGTGTNYIAAPTEGQKNLPNSPAQPARIKQGFYQILVVLP